jgi:bis(5'-nucleosidyl)-tetraphosphatase
MRFEKSCGAVVYNVDDKNIEFLIIKHKSGEHWGFPKGHVEIGENEDETALREVKEETGLEVELIHGFAYRMKYSPKMGTIKEVVYFIGLSKDKFVKCQESEIVDYKWLVLKDAINLVTHDNSQKLLREAYFFIRNNFRHQIK